MIVMRPGTLGTILGQKSQDTLNSAHYTFIKVIHRKLIAETCTTSSQSYKVMGMIMTVSIVPRISLVSLHHNFRMIQVEKLIQRG